QLDDIVERTAGSFGDRAQIGENLPRLRFDALHQIAARRIDAELARKVDGVPGANCLRIRTQRGRSLAGVDRFLAHWSPTLAATPLCCPVRAISALKRSAALMAPASAAARPSANLARARRLCRASDLALDLVAGADPGVDAAVQRTNPLEPELSQLLRDLDRRRFIRTGAIHDDFVVLGNAVKSLGDVLDVYRPRAGYASGRRLGQRRAHIDDGTRLVGVDQLAKLVDGDAIHAQLLDEQAAPPPFEQYPRDEAEDDQHRAVLAQRSQLVHHVADRIAKYIPQ